MEHDTEQDAQIARVRSRIATTVLRFCASRLLLGAPEFRGSELTEYVIDTILSAPASPDRILRQLRTEGLLDYTVINRRGSIYRVTRVSEPDNKENT